MKETIKNNTLYSDMKQFILEFFSLSSSFKNIYEKNSIYIKKENIMSHSLSIETKRSTDLPITLFSNEKVLNDNEIYKKILMDLETDPVISKHLNVLVGTRAQRTRLDPQRIIIAFISSYMEQVENYKFDEDIFTNLYKKFESFFYNDYYKYRKIVPLINISIDMKEINLEDNMKIKQFDLKELNQLINTYSFDLPPMKAANITNYIEYNSQTDKIISDDDQIDRGKYTEEIKKENEMISKAIFALQLYKGIKMDILTMMEQQIDSIPFFGISSYGGLNIPSDFVNRIELKYNEISDFLELWSKISKLDLYKNKELNNSIQYFNSLLDEKNSNFIIIKSFILIESLFDKNPKNEPFIFQLDRKDNKLNLNEYNNLLGELYTLRNKITHGELIDEKVSLEKSKQIKEISINLFKYFIINDTISKDKNAT